MNVLVTLDLIAQSLWGSVIGVAIGAAGLFVAFAIGCAVGYAVAKMQQGLD